MALAAQLICGARAARFPVELDATLRDATAQPIAVEIEDISITGFLMRTKTALRVGDEVTIGIAGLGMRHAVVTRQQDERYGCLFARPVLQREIDLLQLGPLETVTRFEPAQSYASDAIPQDHRYSVRTRLLVIVGLTSACWAVIGAVVVWLW